MDDTCELVANNNVGFPTDAANNGIHKPSLLGANKTTLGHHVARRLVETTLVALAFSTPLRVLTVRIFLSFALLGDPIQMIMAATRFSTTPLAYPIIPKNFVAFSL